jgi:nucleoside-diphosphate-sugar epimerase
MRSNSIIVTGVNSGLGRYIHNQVQGSVGLHRQNVNTVLSGPSVDTIIHCAFDAKREVKDYYQYFNDNLYLTKQLLSIPHQKFIYVSSVDVYREEQSYYKLMKLMAESIVENESNNYIIARCSAMLGEGMRKNTLVKLSENSLLQTGLSEKSTFNYILYEDILSFFHECISSDITGVYNLVSKTNITLSEVGDHFNQHPEYGNYIYKSPNVESNIPLSLSSMGTKTSLENIKRFKNE